MHTFPTAWIQLGRIQIHTELQCTQAATLHCTHKEKNMKSSAEPGNERLYERLED